MNKCLYSCLLCFISPEIKNETFTTQQSLLFLGCFCCFIFLSFIKWPHNPSVREKKEPCSSPCSIQVAASAETWPLCAEPF